MREKSKSTEGDPGNPEIKLKKTKEEKKMVVVVVVGGVLVYQ